MVTPELESYVKEELARGVAVSALRTALEEQGWDKGDIEKVLPATQSAPATTAAPSTTPATAAQTSPATLPVTASNPAVAGEATASKPKGNKKIFLIVGVVLLLLLLAGGAYYLITPHTTIAQNSPAPSISEGTPTPSASASVSPTPSSTPSANTSTVTVTAQTTGKPLLSYTVPTGWVQEAYYPSGTGTPIAAFPTLTDKQASSLTVANSIDVTSDKIFRAVTGLILPNKPNADLSTYDRYTTGNAHYVSLLLAKGTFTNGSYRCQEVKDGSAVGVNCYVNNNGTLLNYIMHTSTSSLTSDTTALYVIIESTSIL